MLNHYRQVRLASLHREEQEARERDIYKSRFVVSPITVCRRPKREFSVGR